MENNLKKNNSIMKKMIFPLIIVMLIQTSLFCATILWGGTIKKLNDNSFDILNERVINRKNYIQNEMLQRWSKTSETELAINSSVKKVLDENNASIKDVGINEEINKEIIKNISKDLIYLLRKNSVTGSFIILNNKDIEDDSINSKDEISRTGLYIRDLDPKFNPNDNSDLLIERGSSEIARNFGISMDSYWAPKFSFKSENERKGDNFFYKPFRAAIDNPNTSSSNLGYWGSQFLLTSAGDRVITYSVPLIYEDGTVYGVLGIDLGINYLRELLPYGEINENKKGNYILGVDRNDDLAFENVVSNGYTFKEKFWDGLHSNLEQKESYKNVYKVKNEDDGKIKESTYASVQYLDLYNSNTPFENERWALLGIIEEKSLLCFSKRVETLVIVSVAVSLVIGLIGIYIASRLFTKPIVLLVNKVRNSNPSKPVNLDKINISEIDELSSAIELLSANVADSSSKLSQIIEMADMPIGAFELYKNGDNVFCTKGFFSIFATEDEFQEYGYISKSKFLKKMKEMDTYLQKNYKTENIYIYKFESKDKKSKWIRLNLVEDDLKILGVVVDVTKEFIEKMKIEYERDFDILTNLLNRRAFYSQVREKFENKEELKIAAFIMWDLDNLKYINDTYGHDAGDEYIRCAADILKKFISWNGIVSRLSGDEFYVFIYGYESKDSIRTIINSVKTQMNNTLLKLHDGTEFKIRASAGISWYPSDSTNYDELMKYADFAMYQIKNTIKGEVSEFDINIYNKDSFLLHNREELNKLIDGQLVEYAFQPIVDCKGEVFAYEALMRPKMETFSSPMDVIRLARSQSKLYQIERITWFKALKSFKRYREKFGVCKLFLNSIPNNNLSKVDFEEIEDLYGNYLNRVVLEITENDKISEDFIDKKKVYINNWNIEIALDDFGTGYNGDAVLLYIMPNYVKIDMSIVRGIDKDEDRKKILKNLISYSKERNIKVIAEGVETKSEMEALVAIGIDYIQGYYVGKPEFVPQDISDKIKQELKICYENRDDIV
ncbi:MULTISPECIES: EAL domain-containing protein [unclassified Clostridioides]|uniref:EAL domain-containing protein n=1 Tax=unclassified Clostridioides TaxID=2635829 RepID=UPI001D11B1C5|nr:EAL domain-containing protein [Clostridioides sp. ZZV14-6154]MCC0668673.1 EAL domain-containing protein [Clostridioides sp. ZZV14-6153]MCC0717927.1 EAL domain-containing protein [Clostridioides sp. ZZV14-6105]MCC0725988.1 EAL domain-containing protein [Clostridioides sp. ZZV14-6045]MCC0731837.1 EAL domain-containing protein [Clostridioides sp. ZZV14-6048]MCC0735165.1 EAL domain-containing protein [Clostridioides sp. ZZV14-6009]MCC0738945.1 EAL domain-containing protein [Clostridioides sp. 